MARSPSSASSSAKDALSPPRATRCVATRGRSSAMVRIPASRTPVPALPAWSVPRPALWRRLAAARPGQLVAVIAPAGSGKTVLLAEWARHGGPDGPGPATAWAGLDRDDADPDRFWAVLVA